MNLETIELIVLCSLLCLLVIVCLVCIRIQDENNKKLSLENNNFKNLLYDEGYLNCHVCGDIYKYRGGPLLCVKCTAKLYPSSGYSDAMEEGDSNEI